MHMKLSPEQSNKVIFSQKQASVQLCAFELDHCMSLCGNHTINNMSCSRRGELERIKTFICMIMFALPEALYGHEWQFDFWGDAGGQIAAAENETLVDAPSTGVSQSFSFRYMVIYLNSFWQIMPHEFHLWVRTLDTAHNDDMTVYGVVAFESHSKGPWTGSMIRIQNRWSLESRDKWTHHETRNLLGAIRESTDFIDTSECIPLELCDLCSQTETRYGHAAERKRRFEMEMEVTSLVSSMWCKKNDFNEMTFF